MGFRRFAKETLLFRAGSPEDVSSYEHSANPLLRYYLEYRATNHWNFSEGPIRGCHFRRNCHHSDRIQAYSSSGPICPATVGARNTGINPYGEHTPSVLCTDRVEESVPEARLRWRVGLLRTFYDRCTFRGLMRSRAEKRPADFLSRP